VVICVPWVHLLTCAKYGSRPIARAHEVEDGMGHRIVEAGLFSTWRASRVVLKASQTISSSGTGSRELKIPPTQSQ